MKDKTSFDSFPAFDMRVDNGTYFLENLQIKPI
ncbi:hypothetical protein SAMN05216484_11729 [Proteus mirabilis]|nr:hypothetical protein SAMN05216484_11729 [Proteus mirabilis]